MNKKENLIWIDLEMTGLDTTRHVILEIASLVTDSQLNILAQGPSLVIHQPEENLKNMHPWVLD
ncbi:exonuclease domain-containing protein, partial [Methylicorpusculum sp.]|uniref:exonuclease domain-containing protein n=1 Tax=Methylicorpusculum sp. TaxID=2713644 RepID=UPI002ABAEAD7